jgi:hypothetical protein
MQIPILNGIYTDNTPELRTSYPVNMVPVPKKSGISNGFLRPGDGIVANGTGPGTDRGGINWNGVCYRVMGTKLVTVASNGAVTVLGDVGGPVNHAGDAWTTASIVWPSHPVVDCTTGTAHSRK